MAERIRIHPEDPQPRLLRRVVAAVHQGAVVAYPTDSSYAVGCHLGDKTAMERIRTLRGFRKRHHFTLLCRDLSEIATFAQVDNVNYRLLKTGTPGPYTFVLPATRVVPRRLMDPRRKTIGVRVPENRVASALLEVLNEPLMSCTLIPPDEEIAVSDPDVVEERFDHQLDIIVDGGTCNVDPTTVVDLTGDVPRILRVGRGDPASLGLD